MERLFLKQLSIIIITFSFLGCSTLSESIEDLNGNKMDVSLDKKETLPKPEIDLEKVIETEVINNVWDYLKNNSSYDEIELNEKTLSFMNRPICLLYTSPSPRDS